MKNEPKGLINIDLIEKKLDSLYKRYKKRKKKKSKLKKRNTLVK